MTILHTSDWHLGKSLEGYSRLDEQKEFIDELVDISDKNNVDMILISGDIYDNGNPPAEAERLFYSSIKKLSINGTIPVVIVSGNHDNPDRLTASNSWAYEQGAIILGTPKSEVEIGNYGSFKIISVSHGYFEMEIDNQIVCIIALPYPSEKRINELIGSEIQDEQLLQKTYSDKIAQILDKLSQNYRDDTVNIAISHLFTVGGKESDSERPIQLGGSLAVNSSAFPPKAQYIALGHLHRAQRVGDTKAYYSGSPIQYSKSEAEYSKSVYIIDIQPNSEAKVKRVMLRNYKPIEIWKCSSVDEAIQRCQDNKDRNIWVYIEIHTDCPVLISDIKAMKSIKKDIVEIYTTVEQFSDSDEFIEDNKSIFELFKEFYISEKNIQPSEEILKLFETIAMEDEHIEA